MCLMEGGGLGIMEGYKLVGGRIKNREKKVITSCGYFKSNVIQ